jgi:hypothetical protein
MKHFYRSRLQCVSCACSMLVVAARAVRKSMKVAELKWRLTSL